MALIEVRGLTKLYRMGESIVRALDGVDLTIERGEFIAITGASGSGKSTMMHLLGCLDRPTSGTYQLDGRDVGELSDRELAAIRNSRIGFVFQTFNLINRTTAEENVGVPLFYARKVNTRGPALRALERVGLATRARHQPNELSGGERQRVAIARAIVNDPLLLLADEPTGNLDTKTGEQIIQIFRALNEQGVTIIIVTHETEIAQQARRIVHMRDGKIVSDHVTADIIAQEGRVAPRKVQTSEEPVLVAGAGRLFHNPGPVAARSVPEAMVAPAASVTEAAPFAGLPPRRVPGANGAFGCGLAAIILWLVVIAAQIVLTSQLKGFDFNTMNPPKVLPPGLVVGAAVIALTSLAAIVVAIVAIVMGAGARRRMREEPGNWQGRRRVLAGLIMGWGGIAIPVIAIVLSVVSAIVYRR